MIVKTDYRDFPCTCGHAESTHRRSWGRCKGKNCECSGFLNVAYVLWFEKIVKSDLKRLKSLKLILLKRINKLAGRKVWRLHD
jgi:hypothetical protein